MYINSSNKKRKGGGHMRNPTSLSLPSLPGGNHQPDFMSTTHFLSFLPAREPWNRVLAAGPASELKLKAPQYDFP